MKKTKSLICAMVFAISMGGVVSSSWSASIIVTSFDFSSAKFVCVDKTISQFDSLSLALPDVVIPDSFFTSRDDRACADFGNDIGLNELP